MGAPVGAVVPLVLGAADPTLDALPSVPDAQAWARLAAPSDEHAVAHTEVVKVVWDRRREELHFCQSERWPLHHAFVLHLHPEEQGRYPTLREFGTRNYLRADRDYVLGSLVHFVDGDLWAFELGPADTLGADEIASMLARVAARHFAGERLRFHPRSAHQLDGAARARLPVLDASTLWGAVRYQPVTRGQAEGVVRFVRGALDVDALRGDELLVTATTPIDLPPVRGLVTAELQTPLSHVAVLSAARATPTMALRGVLTDPAWLALEGRTARLVVGARGFSLEPVSSAAQPSATAAVRVPPLDADAMALVSLAGLTLADVGRVGVKAAQLAEVRRLGLPVLDGFVVPIGHFVRHRGDLVASPPTLRAPEQGLVDDLAQRARALGAERVILRSSANAEDLPGFSGAGLYESVVVDARDAEALRDGLLRVWRSAFSVRARAERARAGVPERDVGMAVLVQPFLASARALGVAITENPYGHRAGYVLNLAAAGSSVTAGEGTAEQWLLYLGSAPELVNGASTARARLLDPPVARRLRDDLRTLDTGLRALYRARGDEAGAFDVELAILPDGRVVFLQARPFGTLASP
ncbi:MAG: hypothetical protein H6726_03710 [Sandaracinaceae bacterium]|nr:hypothetical protein [Sandaracinaceae bacterium]